MDKEKEKKLKRRGGVEAYLAGAGLVPAVGRMAGLVPSVAAVKYLREPDNVPSISRRQLHKAMKDMGVSWKDVEVWKTFQGGEGFAPKEFTPSKKKDILKLSDPQKITTLHEMGHKTNIFHGHKHRGPIYKAMVFAMRHPIVGGLVPGVEGANAYYKAYVDTLFGKDRKRSKAEKALSVGATASKIRDLGVLSDELLASKRAYMSLRRAAGSTMANKSLKPLGAGFGSYAAISGADHLLVPAVAKWLGKRRAKKVLEQLRHEQENSK